ncbi:MAG: Fe(3+) ABC transporter substrate-binding protein [Oscillospiraceae bacterium]|nr:Fe(3+) ABC transporter substrate-binding protein [Oscillospiraceae bacterium]
MKKQFLLFITLVIISSLALSSCVGISSSDDKNSSSESTKEVNIYSARHYDVDKEIYENFEKETGIKVNIIEGKPGELLERIKREGENTKADLFITADMANLYQGIDLKLSEGIVSELVNKNVSSDLRGKNNEWVALTQRARIIAYDKEKVSPQELSTYEDLTSDKWKNRILVRSSDSSYNQSLLASFIEEKGYDWSENWAKGIVSNFARQPEGNDRDQAKGIASGIGDVAIMNSYYLGRMSTSSDKEEVKVYEKLGVFFPENTHVNISGVLMIKYSKNKDNAVRLVEYLTSEYAQKKFTDANYEYPSNPAVPANPLLLSWGTFNRQDISLEKVGEFNKKAIEIFNKIGWK